MDKLDEIWDLAVDAITSDDFKGHLDEDAYLKYKTNVLAQARQRIIAWVEEEKRLNVLGLISHIQRNHNELETATDILKCIHDWIRAEEHS